MTNVLTLGKIHGSIGRLSMEDHMEGSRCDIPEELRRYLSLITELGSRAEKSAADQDLGYLVGELLEVLPYYGEVSEIPGEWRNFAVTALQHFRELSAAKKLFADVERGEELATTWEIAIQQFR